MSHAFAMTESSRVGEARRFALILCSELDFDETHSGRVGIIVNELGNNLVRYAIRGQIIIRRCSSNSESGIEILSVDSGPGVVESVVMQDGFSTGTTPGTGLGAVRRLADTFDFYSDLGKGTVILARVFPKTQRGAAVSERFEIGAINIPYPGEEECGDGWYIHVTPSGCTAFVADGLGHGPEASKAASIAIETLANHLDSTLADQLQHIDTALRGSRGAAIFLLSVTKDILKFAGVGNIRAVVQLPTHQRSLITQNGIAGVRMGRINILEQLWDGHGYLILQSDGLSTRWDLTTYPGLLQRHPSVLAAVLYRDFSRGNDDSTVVVIRWEKP